MEHGALKPLSTVKTGANETEAFLCKRFNVKAGLQLLHSRYWIRPHHLNGTRFVAFDLDSMTGQKVDSIFQEHGVETEVVITTDAVNSVSEAVADGLGVALVYPLFIYGMKDRVISRPFEPNAPLDQYLIYPREARNMPLILDFAEEVKNSAAEIIQMSVIGKE